MKKLLTILLAAALLFSFSACKDKSIPNSVHSASDLAGRTAGVIKDSAAELLAGEYDAAAAAYYSEADLASALTTGAVDCIIMDEARLTGKMTKYSGLKRLEEPLYTASYSIAVAIENPDLLADINSALAELSAEGTLGSIIKGYLGLSDYEYSAAETEYSSYLTLAVYIGNAPYAYFNEENGEICGMDIDIARAICDKLGIGLEVRTAQREKLTYLVEIGELDFAMGCLVPPEEDEGRTVNFSDTYLTSTQVIVVRK